MKWFSNRTISAFPDERAEQCVEYLSFSGERPERDSTVSLLYETIRDYPDEIEQHTYAKILRMDNQRINYWVSMFGNVLAINAVLAYDGTEQGMLANVLQNKNLLPEHYEFIDKKIDNTSRGIMNRQLLERKYE